MSKRKKVSVPASAERLATSLGNIGPNRRFLLVGGFESQKELMKFFDTIKLPAELAPQMAGSARMFINLEVLTPEGKAFHTVQLSGIADMMWKIHAEASLSAGYPIADVRDGQILIHGRENEPIPVSACTGVLHNVYADSL